MKSRRLIWFLFPSYLIIIAIILAAVTGYGSVALRRFFLDQTAVDLEARARLVHQQVRRPLAAADMAAIDGICKTAGRFSGTRITVMNRFGKVLGDSHKPPDEMAYHQDRPEFIAACEGRVGRAVRYSDTLKQTMMYVAIAVPEAADPQAVVRTSLPIAAIDAQLATLRWRIGVGGGIIALVAAGLSWWVSRRLSRPILQIQAGAERFARGDLEHRIPFYDTVELGALAGAMNAMATQLAERIHDAVRQRMEMAAILSSMDEGVVALDAEAHILRVNRAAADFFGGKTPDHCEGLTLQEVVRNNDLLRLVARAEESDSRAEADITLFQPEARIFYARCTPLRDPKERRIGLLLVLGDVTRVRRLENMRRDFAANVSHEIKTPLTAIKGFVETLYHGQVDDPAERRRFLGIIERHVHRLSVLIDDLMRLSRIERDAETRDMPMGVADIAPVLASAVALCQEAAADRGISIALTVPPGPMTGRISAPLLEQAAVNLIDNAVKYSDPGAAVSVCLTATETTLHIAVTDQGPGIPRQHLPRLFERFYRVDKARSRKMGGTGLGLAIVKHIAQAHGGEVTVDSTPGRGSTFTIDLPRHDR